jgi:hypothetical protein
MRTLATFESAAFNTSDSKDYFINPGCFGDDLCRWLIHKLRAAGLETDDVPEQEDFGWFFTFTVADGRHCCVVGYRAGETDNDSGLWILWVERHRGFLGSLLGLRRTGITPSAVMALHNAIADKPEISEIRWHRHDDFDQGREELGSSEP